MLLIEVDLLRNVARGRRGCHGAGDDKAGGLTVNVERIAWLGVDIFFRMGNESVEIDRRLTLPALEGHIGVVALVLYAARERDHIQYSLAALGYSYFFRRIHFAHDGYRCRVLLDDGCDYLRFHRAVLQLSLDLALIPSRDLPAT